MGTAPDGALRWVTFTGAGQITHHGVSLILPGAANIVRAAGDCALFRSLGSGNWRCLDYARADGSPLIAGGAGGLTLIERQVVSGAATVDFTTGIDGTYDAYRFVLTDVVPSNDGVEIRLQISEDAGSNWIATGQYHYAVHGRSSDGTSIDVVNTVSPVLQLNGGVAGARVGADTGEALAGEVTLFTPNPAQPCAALATKHFSQASKPVLDYLAFDGAVSETAGLHLTLPARWDLSALRARVHWAPTVAGAGGESVFWRFYVAGFGDGASLDQFESLVLVTDEVIGTTAWASHLTDWSDPRSVSGAADYAALAINVVRIGGSDSYTNDAAFLGLLVEYDTDQAKDS